MEIEKMFTKIPSFQRIILDPILFESKYPVLFTCKNDDDIYLFLIEYDGGKVKYEWKKSNEISDNILPTIGEYIDAEKGEYKEEIIKLKNMR